MRVHSLLTIIVALFTLVVVLTWLPGYLTLPMWADHDVFATLAFEWSHGQLPYRDRPTTNFPGPIYQAWLFGQLFGWGNTRIIYAFDAALLLTFAGGCIAWSRRRFGEFLPGVIAAAVLVSYQASHDFTQAAQRDWQATAFVLLALLTVAGREQPRWSLVLSAALFAFAFVCRPQVVLFVPALLAVLWPMGIRIVGRWIGFSAFAVGLFFLPLIVNGIVGDFLREVSRIGDGGIYRNARVERGSLFVEQLLSGGMLVVVAAYLFLRPKGTSFNVWPLLVLGGAVLYRPLSPFPHLYLEQPFRVALAIAAMPAVAAIGKANVPPSLRFVGLLLLIASLITPWPRGCDPRLTGKTWRELYGKPSKSYIPVGYSASRLPTLWLYPWADYRDTIAYLRTTSPDVPVANLLLSAAAINGPTAHRTPLHAESLMWLTIVGRPDHVRFAEELKASPNTLAVWRPIEWQLAPDWACIPETLRTHYEPLVKFGEIEIWQRR